MERTDLYFAYGTNMNRADLQAWCDREGLSYPLAGKVGNAWLPDMCQVFNFLSKRRGGGVSNLRHRTGQATPGVLYETLPDGWSTLDAREGAPNIYKRLPVVVLTEDGREHSAVTYQVDPAMIEGTFVPPHPDYLGAVREALVAQGLDDRMFNAVSLGFDPPWTVDRLFVYGTLMEGGPRHHILETWGDHTCRGTARAPGLLFDSGKNFPCMIPPDGEDAWVAGEVYPLRDPRKAFEMFDIVEGFKGYGNPGSRFRRTLTRVRTLDGSCFPAWVFMYAGSTEGMSRIASGSWQAAPPA
jgi:gamma-glutamylcyclotransferase (GGCT)/AIG2-like uncharacterized protein YtfP